MQGQLELFELPGQCIATADHDAELIALGIYRHGYSDVADHQRGWIVLDWDTAGGQKKGDLISAWVCCVCGEPEPNQYWLANNHSCYLIPGCASRPRPPDAPWRFRFADPEQVARHLATVASNSNPAGGLT